MAKDTKRRNPEAALDMFEENGREVSGVIIFCPDNGARSFVRTWAGKDTSYACKD